MSINPQPFVGDGSLLASRAQRCFTFLGYYTNGFTRYSVRYAERLSRPMPQGGGYCREAFERVMRLFTEFVSIPMALTFTIPAFSFYGVAAGIGRGRFQLIQPGVEVKFWQQRSIKVMALNACFQDPGAPFTGGVVAPFEPVGNCSSRIAAVVNAIADEDPAIFMGQEFDNLGAQDEAIRLLKQKGYRYFLRDLGSNDLVRNHSGLFVASKILLQNIEFVPYPSEDRAGLAKWAGQGALTFMISLQGGELRLINVHLNYGEGKECQDARNRQLKRHVVPLLNRGKAVLLGDLNFDTAAVDPAHSGLVGLVNALEGRVTCTDSGKHTLRGKSRDQGGRLCTECEERIDGVIYKPGQVEVVDVRVKQLVLGNQLLSDHSATVAMLGLV